MLARVVAVLALAAPMANGAAAAQQCRLDSAAYLEGVSGATIQFRPKDPSSDAALTSGLFVMRLPNLTEQFEGDIAWNAGGNARPDGEIGRKCSADESLESAACWLWTGNVYGLGDAGAGLLGDADMAAPKAILFSDFGRSLATYQAFAAANPDRGAFDVFTLTGCGS